MIMAVVKVNIGGEHSHYRVLVIAMVAGPEDEVEVVGKKVGVTMSMLKGMIENGQVILDEPAGLPNGTQVAVVPIGQAPTMGMREEDWPMTPEGIAALLARMDSREPLNMSPEEEARWKQALQEEKEYEKARFLENAEKLRSIWE
jgi:hypothetical protein